MVFRTPYEVRSYSILFDPRITQEVSPPEADVHITREPVNYKKAKQKRWFLARSPALPEVRPLPPTEPRAQTGPAPGYS